MKKKFKAEYKQMLKDGARTERADEAGCEAYAEKSKDGISKMKFHIALSLTMTNPDIWNIIRPDIEPLLQKTNPIFYGYLRGSKAVTGKRTNIPY